MGAGTIPADPASAALAAVASPGAASIVIDRNLLLQGIALQNEGRLEQAQAVFELYLTHIPDEGVALYSLAVVLMERFGAERALPVVERGVQVASTFAPIWYAAGAVQQRLGLRDAAIKSYDKALELKPDYVEALINSGTLLREQLDHHAAIDRFNRALALKPDHLNAMSNLAIMLTEFKRSEEAVAMFERLLAIKPDFEYGVGSICYERMHACDWSHFESDVARILDGIAAGKPVAKSLGVMSITDDAAVHHRCAEIFAAHRYTPRHAPLWTGQRYRHDRIRVAYMSPDLREHPVGHLMAGIFERHDRRRFETIAISIGANDGSRLRQRMVDCFDHFIDAKMMESRKIAELMRSMEVDIAIDLAGFTADSRSEVFGMRPAPVQVNYLGYPGTMGTPYMDYLVADRHVIPPEHARHYNEKVVYLPDAYLPAASGLQVAERTPTRAECGLPDEGVVFCSFNHDYKIAPHVFAVWMNLLREVPGSVLWLMSRSPLSQGNLRKEAAARGVDPDRLVFAQRVPRVEDHLARYRQADLFLDTHPYNAHTTCADALMVGLPVVTCMGGAFPSRVAGSLLHAAGIPELVTSSLADYEALALQLARDPARLAATKARLVANRSSSALCDADGFTRSLEAIYTAMWRQSQLGGARDALSGVAA
ncbi:MAG: tetratricopeptide repeat protein [Burkholderiales bacterium]|nr:tetratricopeptide repeat protein [Burkholderiales bacterium]